MLFEFVRESLVDGWQPFELIAPGSQKLRDSEDVALAECNLVSLTRVKAPAASVGGFFSVCLHICSGPRSSAHVCLGCSCAGRHRSSRRKEPLPPQTRAAGKPSDPELKAVTTVPASTSAPSVTTKSSLLIIFTDPDINWDSFNLRVHVGDDVIPQAVSAD